MTGILKMWQALHVLTCWKNDICISCHTNLSGWIGAKQQSLDLICIRVLIKKWSYRMILNKNWIEDLAKKYDEDNKKENILESDIIKSIEIEGLPPSYITKGTLEKIARWKSARVIGHIEKNDEQYVKEVTQVSFSTKNEKLKIKILTLLDGVKMRMASAILCFCFQEQYTVMDYRAWDSLKALDKIDGEISDTFECWQKYNEICREIAKQNGVSLRELDKALWQYQGGAK